MHHVTLPTTSTSAPSSFSFCTMKSGVERGTTTVIGSPSSRAQKAAARPALPPVCVDGVCELGYVSKQGTFSVHLKN